MGCMASKELESEVRFREGPDLLPVPPALEVGVKQYRMEPAQVAFPEVSMKSKSSRLAAKQAAKQKMAALMEQQNVEVIKALEQQKEEIMASMKKNESLVAVKDEETLATVKDEGKLAGLWYDIDDDSFITVDDDGVADPQPTPNEEDEMEHDVPAEAPALTDAVIDKIYGAPVMSPITSSSSDHADSVIDKIHGAPIMSPITASSSDHADSVIDKIHGAPIMSLITASSSDRADEEVVQVGEAAIESKEADVEHNEPAEAPLPRHAVIRRIYGRSSLGLVTSKSSGDDLARGIEVDVLNIGYDNRDEPKSQPRPTNSSATRHKEIMTESGDLREAIQANEEKDQESG